MLNEYFSQLYNRTYRLQIESNLLSEYSILDVLIKIRGKFLVHLIALERARQRRRLIEKNRPSYYLKIGKLGCF